MLLNREAFLEMDEDNYHYRKKVGNKRVYDEFFVARFPKDIALK
jgi:hypothetical protein